MGAPPPREATEQPDGSFVIEREDGETLRWTKRRDGSWRNVERKRAGWVGDLELEAYAPPHARESAETHTAAPSKWKVVEQRSPTPEKPLGQAQAPTQELLAIQRMCPALQRGDGLAVQRGGSLGHVLHPVPRAETKLAIASQASAPGQKAVCTKRWSSKQIENESTQHGTDGCSDRPPSPRNRSSHDGFDSKDATEAPAKRRKGRWRKQ